MIMNLLLLHFAFNPNIQKTTFTKPIQIDYNVTFSHHPFQIQNANIIQLRRSFFIGKSGE